MGKFSCSSMAVSMKAKSWVQAINIFPFGLIFLKMGAAATVLSIGVSTTLNTAVVIAARVGGDGGGMDGRDGGCVPGGTWSVLGRLLGHSARSVSSAASSQVKSPSRASPQKPPGRRVLCRAALRNSVTALLRRWRCCRGRDRRCSCRRLPRRSRCSRRKH